MTAQPEMLRTALAARRLPHAAAAELREHQDRALRRLVQHAYAEVPYYRALFDRHRLHPRHIRGTRDLDLIPLSSKAEMRLRPERERLAAGVEPARLLSVRTSGSSGEPFTIRRSWREDKVQYLLRLRAFHALGFHPRDRVVAVGVSRPTDGDRKEIGRALQRMGFLRRARIDGFQSPPAVLRELAQARADVLVGYPGMLDRLTAPELAPLRTGIRPRVVLTGGEVLTGAVRARLRAAFGAEVVESYASHEFPLLAWSCREGEGLHVCDDGVVLEVLRDGRPAAPGEQGEVVVTNLHAYTMPFIRYRLGDLAVRGAGCACGRPFSTIGAIDGRVIDYFPLPNGRALHPYEIIRPLVIGGDDWIRRYQLVQERADRIVLRVVAAPPPPAARLAEIGCSVRSLLGPDVRFSVELVDEIPFSDSGKSRASWTMVRPATDA